MCQVFSIMNPKPSVIEVFGQDEKIAALKQFIKHLPSNCQPGFIKIAAFSCWCQNGQASLGIWFLPSKDSSRSLSSGYTLKSYGESY